MAMTELERMAREVLADHYLTIEQPGLARYVMGGAPLQDLSPIMTALTKAPPGWKLVPEDPSEPMIDAAVPMHTCEQGDSWYANHDISDADVKDIWQAMLAAAPEYEDQ